MPSLLASPLGLVVGLVLGALGGGGSVLAIPALVYGAGLSFQSATTASLVVVGAVSIGGAVRHGLDDHLDLRGGLTFGASGVAGAFLGTYVHEALPEDVLKVAFAVLVVVVAVKMLHDAGELGDTEQTRDDRWWRVLGAGTAVGVLTGLFGVGGGFVIVPALVLLLGYEMNVAIGTSLVVITINAAAALAARAGTLGSLDWGVVLPFTALGLVGVVIGGRIADRLDGARLSRWFAFGLVAVAITTAVDGATGLLTN